VAYVFRRLAVFRYTWLNSALGGGPSPTPPIEFKTADGVYFKTADGVYFGVPA
jgi:hypothetical protein